LRTFEELDEFPTAVTILDQGMDLAIEQIDASQQADRAMAFVLVVTREGREHPGLGRQVGDVVAMAWMPASHRKRRSDWLARFLRFGRRPFQDLNLAIDAQNLGHLAFKFSVAALQIVAHLMRLDFLLAKNLAHGALDQAGEAVMASHRPVLARMPRQQRVVHNSWGYP